MKYTAEEEFNEIMRRSKKIKLRREHRRVQLQAYLTGVLSVMVIVALIFLPGIDSMTSTESIYGAFLLANKFSGYVLIALISFILGIIVASLCSKYKRLHELEDNEEEY